MYRIKRWTAILLAAGAVVSTLTVAAHDGVPGEVHEGRPTQVWAAFPLSAEGYKENAAELVRAGIPERYGQEEWAAIVMTHEFHQHVGIYTLLGAKMAVRARQLLDAPMRAVHVTSETGTKQPLACTIDGFQAALGSTLGQNLIDVPETEQPQLAAVFEYKGRTLRLSLEEKCAATLADIINSAREAHGDLTPAYFQAIEKATFKVWAEFDRAKVFKVEQTLRPLDQSGLSKQGQRR